MRYFVVSRWRLVRNRWSKPDEGAPVPKEPGAFSKSAESEQQNDRGGGRPVENCQAKIARTTVRRREKERFTGAHRSLGYPFLFFIAVIARRPGIGTRTRGPRALPPPRYPFRVYSSLFFLTPFNSLFRLLKHTEGTRAASFAKSRERVCTVAPVNLPVLLLIGVDRTTSPSLSSS